MGIKTLVQVMLHCGTDRVLRAVDFHTGGCDSGFDRLIASLITAVESALRRVPSGIGETLRTLPDVIALDVVVLVKGCTAP